MAELAWNENWDINGLLEVHSKELVTLNGSVDLVVGGPPCQGFSTGKKMMISEITGFICILELSN